MIICRHNRSSSLLLFHYTPANVIVIVIFITVLLLWRLFDVKRKKNVRGCTKMIASVFAVSIWFPRCRGHEAGYKIGLDENKDAYILI